VAILPTFRLSLDNIFLFLFDGSGNATYGSLEFGDSNPQIRQGFPPGPAGPIHRTHFILETANPSKGGGAKPRTRHPFSGGSPGSRRDERIHKDV